MKIEDNDWINEIYLKVTIQDLEEENKKLKEKLEKLQDEYDELYIEKCNASNQWKCCEAENKELKEKNQTLELWLDNKEKLNEENRKQLDKYKNDIIYEEWLYD